MTTFHVSKRLVGVFLGTALLGASLAPTVQAEGHVAPTARALFGDQVEAWWQTLEQAWQGLEAALFQAGPATGDFGPEAEPTGALPPGAAQGAFGPELDPTGIEAAGQGQNDFGPELEPNG